MRVSLKFNKSLELYTILDQLEEYGDGLDKEAHNKVAKLPLLFIDWIEKEETNIDLVTHLVLERMKKSLDSHIARLEQGVDITYGEWEHEKA